MIKKILGLTLSVILLFSLIACKETRKNTSLEENQVSTGENKDKTQKAISNIVIEDLIEMRDSKLWVKQEDLYGLSLDGEHYEFPEKILEMIKFSHVIINYPLLVFNTDQVYNLEDKQLIFTAEDITLTLEEVWGKTMGVNGVNPFVDMEIKPQSFNFIDNVSLSPSNKKVAFSIHNYVAAMFTTVIGIYNIDDNEVDFVEGPSMGQVQEITWSPDDNYFAYITNSSIDEYKQDIYVINSKDFTKVTSVTTTELFEQEMAIEKPQESLYKTTLISGWLENDSLSIQLIYTTQEGDIEKVVTKIIKY